MGRRRYQKPNVFKSLGKNPMWYFRARVDTLTSVGEKKSIERPETRYYLGYCAEIGKREAEKRRDEMLGDVINRPQVLIPSQVKFIEVIKIYRRDHLAEQRETTQATQESALTKHIEPTLGVLRMCDLDALAVQRWLSGMELAYKTKAAYLSILRAIWRKAEDWGYTQQPFPRGKFALGPRRAVKGHEMPSMEQLRRLLLALEDPYRAMAEVALYSGLRISEVRGLKWEDIGPSTLTIRRRISQSGGVDVPKTERSAREFAIRPLVGVLSRLPRTSEWIFGGDGLSYSNLARIMADARETAGITVARFGWHHLRGVFNTLARSSGADSVDRQALMGHSTEAMNAVYVMQAESDMQRRGDLMMAVQELIMGETKGKVQ